MKTESVLGAARTKVTNMPDSSNPNPTTLLIGLSGPSSSGKTTLARLLRQLFSLPSSTTSLSLFILHQDDFYHTDANIPLITTPSDASSGIGSRTLQDWDCVESLDLDLLGRTLAFVKNHGRVPVPSSEDNVNGDGEDWSESKEDQNSVGPVDLPAGLLDRLRNDLESWWNNVLQKVTADSGANSSASDSKLSPPPKEIRLCLLDGFLLYPDPNPPESNASAADLKKLKREVTDNLSLKLLVLAPREKTIARRTRRTGYVTLEGFWEDPPGYVEDVVWRNWERDGGWLMKNPPSRKDRGSAEASGGEADVLDPMVDVNEDAARAEGIKVAPGRGDVGLGEMLSWAVGELQDLVQREIPVVYDGALKGQVDSGCKPEG